MTSDTTAASPSTPITWNAKVFDIIAGMGVFIAVTLILADVEPDFAYAILIAAFGYMVITNVDKVGGFLGNFRSAIGKA